ncbi:DsbE family thiol:disulfide interchange protein [Pseudahrensia aquimaris]|uniref:DsbE family thiol:disulfide interchange protein n=1 Tax=Pseudahrensia aquimaris TaxID=744461 RepID=A0ABW3FH64_9HYPH
MSEDAAPPRSGSSKLLVALPLLVFGAMAVFFLVQLLSGRDSQELPSALVGRAAPEFTLPPLPRLQRDGVPVPGLASSDMKGKPHLVNIFASWCAPCRAEHPILMSLANDERFDVVGINYKDDPGNALRFLGGLGNPFDRVGIDPRGRAALDWGFYGIPETFLIDKDGIVRHKVIGPLTPDKLEGLKTAIDAL